MLIQHSKPFINQDSIRRVAEQIDSCSLSRGAMAERFAEALKDYTQAELLYLTPSGSAALLIALSALNVGAGDEVILPTYVCHSVADAILYLGATPVFCDTGENWVMTTETVKKVLTAKTRTIIVVHIFGIYAAVPEFRKFGVPVIEDCCQCFANEIEGNKIGVDSDMAFYSFHATKCLTTGEGGAVACFNEKYGKPMAKAIEKFAAFFPFTDVQAALGLSQLRIYHTMLKRRMEIARYYLENLPDNLTKDLRDVPATMYFRFPLRMENDFEAARSEAESAGVTVRKGVDELLHQRYGFAQRDFPVAEQLFNSTICIPIYPALTDAEMRTVTATIKKITDED